MTRHRWIALVVAAAIAARISVIMLSWGRVSKGDPEAYLTLARNILAGHGMAIYEPAFGTTLRALYPPLYPLLLALVGLAVPLDQPTTLAINTLVDLGTAAAMVWLAAQLGQRRVGYWAAAIYLFWPHVLLFAPLAQKEGLAAMLCVLAAALLVSGAAKPSLRTSALFGVVAGLLALTQPALAPLPAAFALALYRSFDRRAWWRMMAVGAASAALVMVPWWIRNYLVFETFVPLTTASGIALWIGTFNPTGWWLPPDPSILTGEELSTSRAGAAAAWAWISQHPVEYIIHCVTKVGRALAGGWWAIDRLMRMEPFYPPVIALLPITLVMAALLNVLALVGLLTAGGTFRRLAVACLAQIFLFQMWFEFSERHTYFLMPFLLLIAVAGARLAKRGRRR